MGRTEVSVTTALCWDGLDVGVRVDKSIFFFAISLFLAVTCSRADVCCFAVSLFAVRYFGNLAFWHFSNSVFRYLTLQREFRSVSMITIMSI